MRRKRGMSNFCKDYIDCRVNFILINNLRVIVSLIKLSGSKEKEETQTGGLKNTCRSQSNAFDISGAPLRRFPKPLRAENHKFMRQESISPVDFSCRKY